ncbi:unnamed protein product [Hyaloperonospora brassicae]|uniref:Cystathionine gamma-synthase n=1 Tax=Hyaloperonospora brassicae TaxID=162125 RepID=A0AAV0TGI7_HYABA|nr:unnamed protein product [Hyaloperonospora brassicae]
MPKWAHVVAYEEGQPDVLSALSCGYPRFFRHPVVVELQALVQNQIVPPSNDVAKWEVMVVPTAEVAQRLHRFLLDGPKPASVKNTDVSVHVVKNVVHAVRFPRCMGHSAKHFWQHAGEIVSSRHALQLLHALQHADPSRLAVPRLGQTAKHRALQARVAARYFESPLDSDTPVALYPTGMAALFATVRLLQQLRGRDGRGILVGFSYVDTLKILSRREWCAQGVHFFPTGSEADLQAVEAIVATEKNVLGIWTEFPSNPLLSMVQLKRLAACAHAQGTVLVVDDTVGSFNVNVMQQGCADLVVTSLSKIFSGSGTVMAGSVVLNPASVMADELRTVFAPDVDSFLAEDDVEVLLEQSENLTERLAKTNASAATIVERLVTHPVVKDVYYPTRGDTRTLYDPFLHLPGETDTPRYGPLVSILLHGGLEPAKAFYDTLTIAKGPSLGTNFTLACPYTLLAHYGELDFVETCGVDRNLIRISIGQEDPEDIWADFEQALAAASALVTPDLAASK